MCTCAGARTYTALMWHRVAQLHRLYKHTMREASFYVKFRLNVEQLQLLLLLHAHSTAETLQLGFSVFLGRVGLGMYVALYGIRTNSPMRNS